MSMVSTTAGRRRRSNEPCPTVADTQVIIELTRQLSALTAKIEALESALGTKLADAHDSLQRQLKESEDSDFAIQQRMAVLESSIRQSTRQFEEHSNDSTASTAFGVLAVIILGIILCSWTKYRKLARRLVY